MAKLNDVLKPKSEKEIEEIAAGYTRYRIRKSEDAHNLQYQKKHNFFRLKWYTWNYVYKYSEKFIFTWDCVKGGYDDSNLKEFIRKYPNIQDYIDFVNKYRKVNKREKIEARREKRRIKYEYLDDNIKKPKVEKTQAKLFDDSIGGFGDLEDVLRNL